MKTTAETQRNAEKKSGGDIESYLSLRHLCDLRASAVRILTASFREKRLRNREFRMGRFPGVLSCDGLQ
jgi:hypothetical protein